MSVGQRIKALRKAAGLTQEKFASRIRISKGFLSNIEKEIREPSDQLMRLISLEYVCSENWLVSGEGEMFLSPEEAVKRLILLMGEQAFFAAARRLSGVNNPATVSGDPDLQRMVSHLTKLYEEGDDDIRAWARVQFARAFPPDMIHEIDYNPYASAMDTEALTYSNTVVMEDEVAYLPVLGEAAAGAPIHIDEALEGYVPAPQKYSRGRYFLIRAKGDSMIGAGIETGDIVIVRSQPIVDNGDIAVVRVADSGAIKYFYRQNHTIILRSANPDYKDIIIKPGESIAVVGKVVLVIKKDDAEREIIPITD